MERGETRFPSPILGTELGTGREPPEEVRLGGGLGERSLGEPPEAGSDLSGALLRRLGVGSYLSGVGRFRGAQLLPSYAPLNLNLPPPPSPLPRSSLGERRWEEGELRSHPPPSQPSSLSGRLFPKENSLEAPWGREACRVRFRFRFSWVGSFAAKEFGRAKLGGA